MKIEIQKQWDLLGESYLNNEAVLADVWMSHNGLVIEVDRVAYIIPKEILTGLKEPLTGMNFSNQIK